LGKKWSDKAAIIIKKLMEKYRELDKPTATSAAEQEDVVLDAWQIIVANFDAEMADGKETFTRNPTQQSVDDEYSIYASGALSAGSTVGTLGFWTTHEHTFPTIFRIAMDYLPIQASAVPCERVFSSSAETDTKKRNRIRPELMEALQVLKYFLKKSRLNFTGHLSLPEPPTVDGAGSANTLREMLKLKPDALKSFLDKTNFDD